MARTASKLVGVDIGASGVRGVELKRSKSTGMYSITRAASVDLPRGAVRNGVVMDTASVVKALRKLWRKGRFSTRKVVIGLSDGSVLTRQIDLPWMPPEDFAAALRYQVTDALPVDLSTVELDYHLLGEIQRIDDHGQPTDVNRILIVASNTEAVTAEANVARAARLQPVVADTSAFALIRAVCGGRLPSDNGVHAIADIGADQLTVAIHQGGQPRFIRTIASVGGETATLGVAERLSIGPDDAERLKRECGLNGPAPVVAPIAESSVFAESSVPSRPALNPRSAATVESLGAWATRVIAEIRNSLDYYQASDPTQPIQTLTLAGRTSLLGGMVERISAQIPLPVRSVDPLMGLTATRKVTRRFAEDSRLVVAAGLAMGA
jgi:type IV pilus assembly protein PilM